MAKKPVRPVIKKEVKLFLADPSNTPVDTLKKQEESAMPGSSPLVKSILGALGEAEQKIHRQAFETDPTQYSDYASIYRMKQRLLPDTLLKRVAIQDDLVAAILTARSNHLSAFGAPQPDRFKYGYKIEPRRGILEGKDSDFKDDLHERIAKATELLRTCGRRLGDGSTLPLKEFLYIQTQNGLKFGRFATEVIYREDPLDTDEDGKAKKKFWAFRYIDAGSIYRATRQTDAQERVRKQARHLLKDLQGERLDPKRFENDEYAWIQVMDGTPRQAFTAEECIVTNLYPCSDYELQGYPVTPIDTVYNAITTHINITHHNRLYFQAGRAARGMIVIQSADVDEGAVARIRAQFQASINGVTNSWRMPVFAVSPDDNVTFQSIDSSGRDMEFQYLSDTNARVILSAFQISPEELPGYAHLSRGTNNQALSESNNEYKLEAARDVGLRPLLMHFEHFLNDSILPLIDPVVAQYCVLRLNGLEAETPEKESVRFQQDMPIHMTMDEVLERVEKKPIGKKWGGQFPLNPQWQAILDKYVFVGEIREYFFEIPDAAKDPAFHYVRDPFYFQNLQIQMQAQQMQQQAQAQQQQAQQPQGQDPQDADTQANGKDDSGGGGGGGGEDGGEDTKKDEGDDLTRALDQAIESMSKGEKELPQSKRRLLAQQKRTIKHTMDEWERDRMSVMNVILDAAMGHAPRARV
jgi:hypothetical protein